MLRYFRIEYTNKVTGKKGTAFSKRTNISAAEPLEPIQKRYESVHTDLTVTKFVEVEGEQYAGLLTKEQLTSQPTQDLLNAPVVIRTPAAPAPNTIPPTK